MKRITQQHHSHPFWAVGGAMVLLLLTLLSWNIGLAAPLDSTLLKEGDVEIYGRIDSFPTALTGDWIVEGITYEANGSTEFKQEQGPFAVEKCVKVGYFPGTSPLTADEIETENDSDCDGTVTETPESTETPDASSTPDETETPEPSETPTPDNDESKVRGVVDRLPDSGLTGTWVIDGVEYLAGGSTDFEQNGGPFVVGACVEVELHASGDPAVIDEIETEELGHCQGTPTSTPEATGTPDAEDEIYGRIDSFPASLVGSWIVNGTTYAADSNSEFEQEHGPFAADVCVKIHVDTSMFPPAVLEVETEHEYRCGNGSTPPATPEAEMFGAIQSFPDGLVGKWNIGGKTLSADSGTEFDQEHVSFGIDVTVKVHFITQDDGTHYAREIETKFQTDSDDDDGDGEFEGAEGHSYGVISGLPDSLIGEWIVGGIVYSATEQTRFEEEDGEFAIDAQVKLEYVVRNGDRVARKIETTSDNGEVSDGEHARLFGYVQKMPASGFVGSWTIDDSAFSADAASRFQEEHGLLGLGAFVSVEYTLQDGQLLIHELETHVPPGAGSDDAVGRIDDSGSGGVVAAMQSGAWTIGGIAYQVSPATNLDDAAAPLTVGTLVTVNSYDEVNGSRVATQIRSIFVGDQQIFLPVVIR
jgi:hypothetical protein